MGDGSGKRRAIEVVDYDPAWPALFEELRAGLERLLAGLVLEIHHIGSTAVPGLCAKPKIDVDIELRSAAVIPEAIERMQATGAYAYHGDRHGDGMWTFTTGRGSRGQRLYLCAPGTAAHLRRMLFRDHLRQHQEAAATYAALKRRLASETADDWGHYTGGKGAFVAEIVRREAARRNQPVPDGSPPGIEPRAYDYEAQYRRLQDAGRPGWAGDQHERALAGVRETLDRLEREGVLSPPPARMLELGCGNGSSSYLLAGKGYEVHGIDISGSAVAWARERFAAAGLRGTFHRGSVCRMPVFADDTFDIVFDGSCLHCLIGDDRAACLAEIRRILRPDGVFVVSSMCGEPRSADARARFDSRTRCLMRDGHPYRTLEPLAALEAELDGAGFAVRDRSVAVNPWWDHATLVCGRSG
ncbi:GrpB family protein [Inquilinus sp.]|uniref:GrpB family protein n=1 Tax=Inquilinus sp. TaxID=1932117 RepID=UPI0031E2004D